MEKLKNTKNNLSSKIDDLEDYFQKSKYIAETGWFREEEKKEEYKTYKECFLFELNDILKNNKEIKEYIDENNNMLLLFDNTKKINLTFMSDIINILKKYLKKRKELESIKLNKSNDIENNLNKDKWEELANILQIKKKINEYNIEEIIATIVNQENKELNKKYKEIWKFEKILRKEKNRDINLFNITTIIKDKIQNVIDAKKEQKRRYELSPEQKAISAQKAKEIVGEINDFIEKNNVDLKNPENMEDFKNNFLDDLQKIIKSVENIFKDNKNLYRKKEEIKHELEYLYDIYKNMNNERFDMAIKWNYLFGDIYELLLKLKEKNGIRLPKKINDLLKIYKKSDG